MKILILEDNIAFAQSLKETMSSEGWDIHLANTWSKASALIDNTLDVLILDIILPDKKGFDILKILSEKTNLNLKIAVISGLVNKSSVKNNTPSALQANCTFFKKPLETKALLGFLKKSNNLNDKEKPFFTFLSEPSLPSQKLNFYFPKNKAFDSKTLISAVYMAHLKKFTGKFKIMIKGQKDCFIRFHEGQLTNVTSISHKSFLGELLVEHGLSLSENIESLLKTSGTSNKRIGERLVEKELLSPYMLNFILKEQNKIRLSEIMSYPSFLLNITEGTIKDDNYPNLDFNESDFMEWLADSVQTELTSDFLNQFYMDIKNSQIQKSMQINKPLIGQKRFLQDYNDFFKNLKDEIQVSDIVTSQENKTWPLRLLYFGLLIKSIHLKHQQKELKLVQSIEVVLDSIINNNSEDLFSYLNLPWNASIQEAEKSHKTLLQKIHPDLLPAGSHRDLKEKSEQAVIKLTQVYKILKNKKERKKYVNNQTEKQFTNMISIYEKGLEQIKTKDYKESLKSFHQIVEHKQAPTNTLLYLLWAQLKSTTQDLSEHRDEAIKIRKQIDSCPISLRTSALFWFVKGLFYAQIKHYEKAKELISKSLMVQKDFFEAKRELVLVQKIIRNSQRKNKSGFFGLFQKSG